MESNDELYHYGKGHLDGGKSGRYPWGSGEEPYQRVNDFYYDCNKKKKDGFTYMDGDGNVYYGDAAIAKSLDLTTTEYRTFYRVAKNRVRNEKYETAKKLREEGYSLQQIADKMGYENDSSVRSLLDEGAAMRMSTGEEVAKFLMNQVDEKGTLNVSKGASNILSDMKITGVDGVSDAKLEEALIIMEAEGYTVAGIGVPQATNKGQQTNMTVVAKPGTEYKELYTQMKEGQINSIDNFITYDNGETFHKSFEKPTSMDSSRLLVKFDDAEGDMQGTPRDGTIFIRPGVEDLYLGDGTNYAQVRILVDDYKYLKGMAVYSNDIPEGYDVVFNSNKNSSKGKLGALKDVKTINVGEGNGDLIKDENDKLIRVGQGKGNLTMDPENPFGSLIKDIEEGGQYFYKDKNGNEKLGLINKRASEGDWGEWSHDLAAQLLSKQPYETIKKQLDLTIADVMDDYDEISNLTNPTVKKKLLLEFANNCDGKAVDLKAQGFPDQRFQVILPVNTLKDSEVYAPNFTNGSQVALFRFPHGGLFEIPILTVNNKNTEGQELIGKTPKDAVGINSKVAGILSGADFDGDTVLVIPLSDNVKIKNMEPLKELKDFDTKAAYPGYKGMHVMSDTQKQMGVISNLITDMTLAGAPPEELARAVKHSMVVIDAEKHKLNYKQSEIDNGIKELKDKYQGRYTEDGRYTTAAATIISRSKGETTIAKRKGSGRIDPETGKMVYNIDDNIYQRPKFNKKTGEFLGYEDYTRTQKSSQMADTDDAFTLVSKMSNVKEVAYAEFANKLKALANDARKQSLTTGLLEYSKEAAQKYENEANSMKAELNLIKKNKPREQQAQLIARAEIERVKQQHKNDGQKMTTKELQKVEQKAITKARNQVGAKRHTITITDKRWEAIQAGAIHDSTLKEILQYADLDSLRSMATPRTKNTLTTTQISRINSMKASGYTTDQIAEKLGVSTSTVVKYG